MNIAISNDAQTPCLQVSGQLDRDALRQNFWQMKEAQTLGGANQIIVNLQHVSRIDTAGLAWLLNFARDSKRKQIVLRFKSIPQELVELARLSNADDILVNGGKNDK